jgi:hypothetical protein
VRLAKVPTLAAAQRLASICTCAQRASRHLINPPLAQALAANAFARIFRSALNQGLKIAFEGLALRRASPIIRVSFLPATARRRAHFDFVEEVIMTVKKNYVPCVDLKNLHIPLT